MVRRFLRLGLILLLLLIVPACSVTTKPPEVPDPDGNYVPNPGGAKPG
jgi:hypothetical protein